VPGISKILISSFTGALICVVLGFFMFYLMASLNKTKASEAIGYSLVVGVGCAIIGVLIGFVIGIGNLKLVGGAIVGVLATLCIMALYVFAFARSGQTAYFLRESKILLIALSLPTILTGIFTVVMKNLIYKS
jgi:hypothetical protein